MMEIRIRSDSVEIDGYVNAVERKSKPLWSRLGQFIERICKGAFFNALKRNDNVRILLNHDPSRDLGGQKDGNLELREDSIGLHAHAVITDPDVVKKARAGELVGWSFGFYDRDVNYSKDENGYPLREVRDLDLEEVSILDNTKSPAYEGTLISVRDDEPALMFAEAFTDEINIREVEEVAETTAEEVQTQASEPVKQIDYGEWEQLITDMKN